MATSEGSALGLYLERWPSPSAAVPAQSMPTENPANRAHRKIPVCIFKPHTLILIENTSVTVTQLHALAQQLQEANAVSLNKESHC